MEKYESAIYQMLNGKRGNMESICLDDEYKEMQEKVVQLEKAFKNILDKQAFEVYAELENVKCKKDLLYSKAIYAEAFSFAFALAQEILNKK